MNMNKITKFVLENDGFVGENRVDMYVLYLVNFVECQPLADYYRKAVSL